MAKRKAFLLVTLQHEENEQAIHIAADGAASDYATLCGLDGYDDGQSTLEAKKGSKVTCQTCYAIWECARHYRKSDFRTDLINSDS